MATSRMLVTSSFSATNSVVRISFCGRGSCQMQQNARRVSDRQELAGRVRWCANGDARCTATTSATRRSAFNKQVAHAVSGLRIENTRQRLRSNLRQILVEPLLQPGQHRQADRRHLSDRFNTSTHARSAFDELALHMSRRQQQVLTDMAQCTITRQHAAAKQHTRREMEPLPTESAMPTTQSRRSTEKMTCVPCPKRLHNRDTTRIRVCHKRPALSAGEHTQG